MQLSNIALATILITMFATGPVTSSSSFSEARAKFKKLEADAAQAQPGSMGRKQLQAEPKLTTASTTRPIPHQSLKPTVTSYPSSSEGAEDTGKPAQPPTKKPTAVSPPERPLPSKMPPAPTQTATAQSATKRPAPELLFLRHGESPKPPSVVRERQQASRGSSFAGLKSMWEESASPPKPSPPPTSSTPSKPSGAPPPPKVTSIPEDTNFTRFKEAIEQRKYTKAMRIEEMFSKESRELYDRHLASLDVSKIPEMVKSYKSYKKGDMRLDGSTDLAEPISSASLEHYPIYTMRPFFVYADDDKLDGLLRQQIETAAKDKALIYSIDQGAGLPLERLVKIFKGISKESQGDAVEAAAECMHKSGNHKLFDTLIERLGKEGILDKDLINFAFNAAFVMACFLNNLRLAQTYYGRAKIFSSMYGKAIMASMPFYDAGRSKNDVFDWLLKTAGRDDLSGLVKMVSSEMEKNALTEAIEAAFEAAKYKFRTQAPI